MTRLLSVVQAAHHINLSLGNAAILPHFDEDKATSLTEGCSICQFMNIAAIPAAINWKKFNA